MISEAIENSKIRIEILEKENEDLRGILKQSRKEVAQSIEYTVLRNDIEKLQKDYAVLTEKLKKRFIV